MGLMKDPGRIASVTGPAGHFPERGDPGLGVTSHPGLRVRSPGGAGRLLPELGMVRLCSWCRSPDSYRLPGRVLRGRSDWKRVASENFGGSATRSVMRPW